MKALISLNSTNQLVLQATKLRKLGFDLIVTSESARVLLEEGIECIAIEDYLSFQNEFPFPPTLHPRMEYELTNLSGGGIDLVYVNPYGMNVGLDVGGHTLLALAVKGRRMVVANSEDMNHLLTELETCRGIVSDSYLKSLWGRALCHIQHFYENTQIQIAGVQILSGENPYQIPAYVVSQECLGLPVGTKGYEVFGDAPPCYTNLADLDSLVHCYTLLHKAFEVNFGSVPYISIGSKHGNACGISVSWADPSLTIHNCLWTDPKSIWGGEFFCNFELTPDLAALLYSSSDRQEKLGSDKWMLDVIVAPDYSLKGMELLRGRKNSKIVKINQLSGIEFPATYRRSLKSGFITEPYPNYVLKLGECVGVGDNLTDANSIDLIIAWAAAYSSFMGGNEIAIAKDGKLISIGGGPSTLLAAEIAVFKANKLGISTEKGVFAADAFLPFSDAAKVLIDAGVKRAVIPSGGVNEKLVIAYLKNELESLHLINSVYRGFIRH